MKSPSIDLTPDQYTGPLAAVAPKAAPKPVASYLEVKLPTTQIRSLAHFNDSDSNGMFTGGGAACAARCYFPDGGWVWDNTGDTVFGQGAGLGGGFFPGPTGAGIAIHNSPLVGYIYDTNKDSANDGFANINFRLGMLYDVSSVAHRSIGAAYLLYHLKRSYVNFADSGAMCGTQLGTATADWWDDAHQSLDAAAFNTLGKFYAAGPLGPNFDVTAIVKAWAADPTTNYGFVMRNTDENQKAFTEKTCVSEFDNLTLDVVYQ